MATTTIYAGKKWAVANKTVAHARALTDALLVEANRAQDGAIGAAAIGPQLADLEHAIDAALDSATAHLFGIAGAEETVQLIRSDLRALRAMMETPPPTAEPLAERLETLSRLITRLDR